MKTLVILNPNASGGRAYSIFKKIEDRLIEAFGNFTVALSKTAEEVAEHVDAVSGSNITRLIAIGGDGTNHAVLNALAKRPDLNVAFGSLPVGTGCDWARSLGTPTDPLLAIKWLARAQATPCDLGKVEFRDSLHRDQLTTRFFLNIASVGASGEVDARVNNVSHRTSSTFLKATIATLFKYRPRDIAVKCDGRTFYKGPCFLLAVANGCYFGHGMRIAPHALINDGLFDVVLVEGMPRMRILLALKTVFSGKHLGRKDVHYTSAASVRVISDNNDLGMDLDGEVAYGNSLRFSVLPGAVNILLEPTSSAVISKRKQSVFSS